MMSSLPGYEAQIAEDGLEHSRKKIHEAGKELCTLFIHNSCQVLHEAPCTIRERRSVIDADALFSWSR